MSPSKVCSWCYWKHDKVNQHSQGKHWRLHWEGDAWIRSEDRSSKKCVPGEQSLWNGGTWARGKKNGVRIPKQDTVARESTMMHGWKIGCRHREPSTHGTIRTFNFISKAAGISKQQNVTGLLGSSPCWQHDRYTGTIRGLRRGEPRGWGGGLLQGWPRKNWLRLGGSSRTFAFFWGSTVCHNTYFQYLHRLY